MYRRPKKLGRWEFEKMGSKRDWNVGKLGRTEGERRGSLKY